MLMQTMWLEPGSVSPFGLINNENKDVEVYIDKQVYDADIVNFHPNINTASLSLTSEMFHKYLQVV
jgi:Ala-tRNA(Pro) deacylase